MNHSREQIVLVQILQNADSILQTQIWLADSKLMESAMYSHSFFDLKNEDKY